MLGLFHCKKDVQAAHWKGLAVALAGALLLGACNFAPHYNTPTVTQPAAFKELTPADFPNTEGWKVAQPKDEEIRGNWWETFNDPQLNALEQRVDVSNQNLAVAAANFLAAKAVVREARAQLSPTVTGNASIANARTPINSSKSYTDYELPFDASWFPDLFGKFRNTMMANAYSAQASAADLENARLAAQAELAADYFQIRSIDAQVQLLTDTIGAYRDALDLTQVRYQTGIASDEDVAQAQTQLNTTQAQATDLGVTRAQLEHAIALLVGQPASEFSQPVAPLEATPPAVPFGVPSQLLERRPDIAAAERQVAVANAQIGIARAAFYPTVTLSAAAGLESSAISTWFSWPSRFWSVGPAISEVLFDAGLRRATQQQFQAQYQASVASYRETVLAAFQQVEDNLAALRVLSKELQEQDAAIDSSQRYLTLATDRYRLGIDSYLNVITAQSTLLTNKVTGVNLRMRQMTASVQLIEALGGGWNASQLPPSGDLTTAHR